MGASQSADSTVSSTSLREKSKQLLEAVKGVLRNKNKNDQEKRNLLIQIGRLLKAGANSKVQDTEGKTCLHYIATHWTDDLDGIVRSVGGLQKFVPVHFPKYFIARGDVNKRDKGGKTSLHWAAYRGNKQIVRLLLSAGAKPDLPDNKDRTPLVLATGKRKCINETNFLEIARILIGAGANIQATKKGTTILQRACHRNDTTLVNLLLPRGASLTDVDKNGFNALFHAVKSHNFKIVKKVIDEGADVNFVNAKGIRRDPSAPMTALHIIIMSNNVAMLKYLLDRGADPNRTNKIGRSILSFAAEARPKKKKHTTKDMTLEKIELLLSYGADMYDGGLDYPESPFESLVSRNRVAEVELFLKHGLDIGRYSPRTPSDFSPLHEAVRCCLGTGASAMLSLLLKHDSEGLMLDLEHVDALGRSPLCLAAEMGSPHSVRLLIDRGADVDHVEGTNRSPLELASALSRDDSSELECIKLLVCSGARLRNILGELSPWNADDEVVDRKDGGLNKCQRNLVQDSLDKAQCIIKYRVLYESQISVPEPIKHISKPIELRRYRRSCRAEITLLKDSQFYGSTSFYDLLTGQDIHEHLKSNQVYESFDEEDIRIRFPLYGQDLCDRFNFVKDMQCERKL